MALDLILSTETKQKISRQITSMYKWDFMFILLNINACICSLEEEWLWKMVKVAKQMIQSTVFWLHCASYEEMERKKERIVKEQRELLEICSEWT